MNDGNTPAELLLREAGKWIDFYGHYDCWSKNDPSSHVAGIGVHVKQLSKGLSNRLECVKHTALCIGKLWQNNPAMFTSRTFDLVTPPDNLSNKKGIEYDKAVLEILIDRCARLPRREDTNLGAGQYMTYVEFPDPPNNSDEIIIDTIDTCYSALAYAIDLEEITAILDILLSSAWELYLRAQEHANA